MLVTFIEIKFQPKYSAVSRQPSAYFIQKLFGVALAMGINCSGSVATALLADS
ncbi:MAG: hypothetical protein F6K50_32680 [Moorea sp. SIO3I7]|nr:hypothetical protein [Moorena sp. SIO3I7]